MAKVHDPIRSPLAKKLNPVFPGFAPPSVAVPDNVTSAPEVKEVPFVVSVMLGTPFSEIDVLRSVTSEPSASLAVADEVTK